MNYTNIDEYRTQLKEFGGKNDSISNQNLVDQESRFKALNKDILQSIQLLVHDYDNLATIEEYDANLNDGDHLVDFESFSEKINEFNKLILSLRMIYLEQESLDNFLRYTISSDTTKLPVDSINDPKFIELENEVACLENNTLNEKQNEISEIKIEITKKSGTLFNDDCMIKELCVETSEDIDTCFQLIEKLDTLQEKNRKANENLKVTKVNKIEETYNVWQNNKLMEKRNAQLHDELAKYDMLLSKTKGKKMQNNKNKSKPEDIIKLKTLNQLTKMLKSYLLPSFPSVRDFEISIHERKIEFIVSKRKDEYKITIKLNDVMEFEDIMIHDLNNSHTNLDSIANKVIESFYNDTNIYSIIYFIINKI